MRKLLLLFRFLIRIKRPDNLKTEVIRPLYLIDKCYFLILRTATHATKVDKNTMYKPSFLCLYTAFNVFCVCWHVVLDTSPFV